MTCTKFKNATKYDPSENIAGSFTISGVGTVGVDGGQKLAWESPKLYKISQNICTFLWKFNKLFSFDSRQFNGIVCST